jgi:dihydrolipoamide dehydrogenase
VVGKLTGGLASMAKLRKVTVLTGVGSFSDAHHMVVETKEGRKTVRFSSADHRRRVAGSQASFLPEDPRIVDSTGALELKGVPKKLLVIGGGIIGLEMARSTRLSVRASTSWR